MKTGDNGMRRGRVLAVLVISGAVGVASACGKTPPIAPPALPPSITIMAPPDTKVTASMSLRASADVNPNDTGRPSPVVVRVYQLRTDTLFAAADYNALFGDLVALEAYRRSLLELAVGPDENTA